MVELPNIEDKIYELFADLLSIEDGDRNETKTIVDIALDENNITMDILISQILEGVENGISIEDQFKIVKKLLK